MNNHGKNSKISSETANSEVKSTNPFRFLDYKPYLDDSDKNMEQQDWLKKNMIFPTDLLEIDRICRVHGIPPDSNLF